MQKLLPPHTMLSGTEQGQKIQWNTMHSKDFHGVFLYETLLIKFSLEKVPVETKKSFVISLHEHEDFLWVEVSVS